MKKKSTAQFAFATLRIVLASLVFFAGVYVALFARPDPQASMNERKRDVSQRIHRANTTSLAPSPGVYEAWVGRYNGPGNNYDLARALAVDGSGNVYVGGPSWGGATAADYATIKYNSAGNEEWVARYNGPGNRDDYLSALAVDALSNVYVTGFSSVDNSHLNCTTIKYNSSGQEQWVAQYAGPGAVAAGDAIAVDGSGNVYVAAEASIPNDANTRFSVTIKYNASGQQQWAAEYDGGMNSNYPAAIALDSTSNAYAAGGIRSCPASKDLVLKYDSAGQEQWVGRYQGPGSGGDSANAIAVDGSGDVYVTGDSWTSGVSSSTIKYNSAGQLQWVARHDQADFGARALAVDSFSNVYVTGQIQDPNAPAHYGTIKYNSAGQQQWVRRYEGLSPHGYDRAAAIAVDGASNVYVTGRSSGAGIIGYPDYATIKYSSAGVLQWLARYNGPGESDDEAVAIAVDEAGYVYITGTSDGDFVTIKYGEGASPTPTVTTTPTPTPTPTATPFPTPGTPTPTVPSPPNTPTPTPTATPTPFQTCCQHLTITGTGTIMPGRLDIGNHCDNCLTVITFPFPVQFYGSTINEAYVNSNGSLQFTSDRAQFGNSCPLPSYCFDAAILVYQDDLRTDGLGDGVFTSISGSAPNRVFNIEWRTSYFGRTGNAKFELRFYENQTFFEMIYGDSDENGASAASGVQQSTLSGPCDSTTFSCQTPTLTNGLKVTYQPWPCHSPTPIPTATVSVTVTPTPPGTPTPTPTPCTGRCNPTPRPRPTSRPRP
jgi:hypothetical protein